MAQQAALLPHSSRVSDWIQSSGYCICDNHTVGVNESGEGGNLGQQVVPAIYIRKPDATVVNYFHTSVPLLH